MSGLRITPGRLIRLACDLGKMKVICLNCFNTDNLTMNLVVETRHVIVYGQIVNMDEIFDMNE